MSFSDHQIRPKCCGPGIVRPVEIRKTENRSQTNSPFGESAGVNEYSAKLDLDPDDASGVASATRCGVRRHEPLPPHV
jgi:hypothetical protein